MTEMVLTANRLIDGIAVWYSTEDTWSLSIQDARVVTGKDDIAALEAIGKKAFDANLVVDAAMVDVARVEGRIQPLRMRERIRAEGPTIDYAPGFGPSALSEKAA
jgi:Protein of unknown function (DUF2849)